jgi:uncharacterized protein YndB with AHSA1/START domain
MTDRTKPEDFGKVTEPGTLRMRRVLPGPIERVWSYLTDSEKRGKWFAAGPMDLRAGGSFEFTFNHANLSHEKETPERWKSSDGAKFPGRVTRCEAPRVLGISWEKPDGGSEVLFELTPQGNEVLLTLTHRRIGSRAEMIDFAGGWHSHLDILSDQMYGREPRGLWTTVLRMEAEYAKRLKDAAAFAADTPAAQPVQARVTQRFAASPERVFDAWLDTAMVGQFMFGPQLRDEEIVRLSLDARVGGRFSFVVRRQGQEIDHIGRYLEIIRPRWLVFTWAIAPSPDDASRVTIEIASSGTGCELTLTHELAPGAEEFKARVTEGWTKMLRALEAKLP